MTRLLLMLAVAATAGPANPVSAQFVPSSKKAAHVRSFKGPELESATENLTIIRWISDNPGGSPEHFGVVHYGKDPKDLSQTAKSHIRLNPTIPIRSSACAWPALRRRLPTTTRLTRPMRMARATE